MTAVFISPHLDDVAFSCGGTVAHAVRSRSDVTVCTVFTRGVTPAEGFALECQATKGFPANVDYLALRREEDRAFATAVGDPRLEWWGFLEAPYRGYTSAAALFGPVIDSDTGVVSAIAEQVIALCRRKQPSRLFVPSGIGGHADHVVVCRAVLAALLELPDTVTCYGYEDLPYCTRQASVPGIVNGTAHYEPIDDVLEAKLAGASAYRSQIPFQFGDTHRLREIIEGYAATVAARAGRDGHGEAFQEFWPARRTRTMHFADKETKDG